MANSGWAVGSPLRQTVIETDWSPASPGGLSDTALQWRVLSHPTAQFPKMSTLPGPAATAGPDSIIATKNSADRS
jgi:hypothetical protein